MNSKQLVSVFFNDLKQYNPTNFRNLVKANLADEDTSIFKCCSSVVTRFFIFKEKHPEISDSDLNLLYYTLKIDLIAKYFSEYPVADVDDLKPFQQELFSFCQSENVEVEDKVLTEV